MHKVWEPYYVTDQLDFLFAIQRQMENRCIGNFKWYDMNDKIEFSII